MIEPTKDDIGRRVRYFSNHLKGVEFGIITSFNNNFVFVRYNGETSQATLRRNLVWADEKPADLTS